MGDYGVGTTYSPRVNTTTRPRLHESVSSIHEWCHVQRVNHCRMYPEQDFSVAKPCFEFAVLHTDHKATG